MSTFRATYRRLRPGESPPPGQPKRYLHSARGYVLLRWKVGVGQYVETVEHRLIAGMPAADVHHHNGDKRDNHPGNLHPLDHEEHCRLHGGQSRARSKSVTLWDGQRSQQAYDKRQRRLQHEAERQQFLTEVVSLYESGLTVTEVGARTGRDNSNISRALAAAGGPARWRR